MPSDDQHKIIFLLRFFLGLSISRVPSVVFDHVSQFDDEFAFLVFLTRFKSVFVFPAESGLAAFAVNVGHCVQSSEQYALFGGTAAHIHHRIEQVGASLAALERL